MGQNLGPVTSPVTHGAAVDAAIQPYAQAQQQALRDAGPVDISGVYKQLQDALPNAAPGTDEHKALSGAISSLTASGEGAAAVPTTSAQVIDSARKGLDDALYPAVPGGQVSSAMRDQLGAYQMARQGISKALKDQIPAYKDATEAIAQIAPQRGAYDAGLDDLTRNVAHYSPDYRQTFNRLAPQVQDSRAAGLRMAVEQAVGTKENDLQALRNATQGANGWNTQNLGHVFGQAPVDNVNQDIAAELRMRDTYGKVTQNAETARRTAMAKALADAEHEPFQIGHVHNLTAEGMVATPLKMAANAVLRAFQPAVDNGARDMQIGQAITAQGDPRNQIMAQLLRAHAVRKANDDRRPRGPRRDDAHRPFASRAGPCTAQLPGTRTMMAPTISSTPLGTIAKALLQELYAGDPIEGIIRAQAMMVAATGFLTRFGGHEIVAAQLRADADLVASFAERPGEPAPQSLQACTERESKTWPEAEGRRTLRERCTEAQLLRSRTRGHQARGGGGPAWRRGSSLGIDHRPAAARRRDRRSAAWRGRELRAPARQVRSRHGHASAVHRQRVLRGRPGLRHAAGTG